MDGLLRAGMAVPDVVQLSSPRWLKSVCADRPAASLRVETIVVAVVGVHLLCCAVLCWMKSTSTGGKLGDQRQSPMLLIVLAPAGCGGADPTTAGRRCLCLSLAKIKINGKTATEDEESEKKGRPVAEPPCPSPCRG